MPGVLLDNTSKHEEAIKAYTKYLQICEELSDSRGVALATNCIGVDYQVRFRLCQQSRNVPGITLEALSKH